MSIKMMNFLCENTIIPRANLIVQYNLNKDMEQ